MCTEVERMKNDEPRHKGKLYLMTQHGVASPIDFDGEFADKPCLMYIEPGVSRVLSYRIRVGETP